MSTIKRRLLVRALVVAAVIASPAAAGEVIGELVCCKKKCNRCQPGAPTTACHDPCCDPCKVGPIRRFFRGCHRKPCPTKQCCPPVPCCPPAPVLVVPPAQIVPAAPPAFVAPGPAVNIAPPMPAAPGNVPPPPVFPGTGSALRRSGTLTPPVAPPPVRADRIASHGGGQQFTLVNAEKRAQQQRTMADDDGRFRATLAAGTWHVYGQDVEGKLVYRGKLEVRETGLITVRMR